MAERGALQKRYAYQEMSNKVEQADQSQLVPRSTKQDGVRLLCGHTDMGHMGDRVPAGPRQRGGSAAKEEAAARASKRQRATNARGNVWRRRADGPFWTWDG